MKTIAISHDTSSGTQTLRNRGFHKKSMEDRGCGSSSEDNYESDTNLVNLYDSDTENLVVPVEHSGLSPY